ncbi:MAG: UDP-3-O-acyl-N-acetylglucosamine deacetylase, partial [Alphaproteobacteria bacterium]
MRPLRGSRQRTVRAPIACTGVGLHSGEKVSMTLHPAAADAGIVFRRPDIVDGGGLVRAHFSNVCRTLMCTTLRNEAGVTVSTVEHLMAALAGCGIDNLLVEIDGPEVPIMDGSAAPFVFLMECAGIVEQEALRRAIQVMKPVRVGHGTRFASLVPSDRFSVSFEIAFDNPLIARQERSFEVTEQVFKDEVSAARTFGFVEDVAALRARGLVRGGSLDNAVVVSGTKVLNEEGLRYEDEFVRHKVLDSIGDLYLAGAPLLAHFHGICSGHPLHYRLLKALDADPTAWREVVLDETDDVVHCSSSSV